MAKRISSAAIGGFVAASFALILGAIIVVGAGNLFQRTAHFVCMFQGNVNGLRIGAPVKFRGVEIGTVEEIRIVLSPSEGVERAHVQGFRIPVIISVNREMLEQYGASGQSLSDVGFENILARGLRAQLATESFLTGLLYVDLDIHPNAPLNLVLIPHSGTLREIPTVPTTLEAIQKKATEAIAKLDALDFQALITSATSAANNISELAGSPDLKATIASLKETIPSLNQTITDTRLTLNDLKNRLIPLAEGLQTNSAQANITMKETTETLSELRAILEPDSPLSVHLNEALDELATTTQSVGALTDYLQRNPAALVRGKYVPEKDR